MMTTCEHCTAVFNFEYDDIKIIDSGKGYNYEFGQMEYWFAGEIECPECGEMTYYSDSSL